MSIQAVIDAYHDILTDEMAEQADEEMRKRLLERGLYFGKRPLCIVLRPHFYFEDSWQYLQNGLEKVLNAFKRAHDICMDDGNYRKQLYLEPYEEQCCVWDVGGPVPWTSSRLDTFYVVEDQSLKVVEYNAETPAGIGYGDVLEEVFDALEPMKRFRELYNARSMPGMGELYRAIMEAYAYFGGREQPQICILDWSDVPTINEHEITREYFERRGTRTILADPRSLDYRNGHLYHGDFRIDIIYKRVLYSELVGHMGVDNAVLNAVRDKAVFITNSPSCKLMAKKASLAFLSDERNAHLFTPEQRQAIEAHIPWTRVVEERKTHYKGREIDLLELLAEGKDQFVLKPNDEYGGKGVVLGWECSHDGWQSSLQQAMTIPHVVQERVPSVQRDFPSWINGELDISPRYVDADPYVFDGHGVRGVLTRLSPMALLNVTAGGGSVVPTYILTKRD